MEAIRRGQEATECVDCVDVRRVRRRALGYGRRQWRRLRGATSDGKAGEAVEDLALVMPKRGDGPIASARGENGIRPHDVEVDISHGPTEGSEHPGLGAKAHPGGAFEVDLAGRQLGQFPNNSPPSKAATSRRPARSTLASIRVAAAL